MTGGIMIDTRMPDVASALPAERAGAEAPLAPAPTRHRSLLVYILLVGLAVAFVHWPAVHSPVTTFDDDMYLSDNLLVQHPGLSSAWQFLAEVWHPSTVRGYYQPLAMISLMIDYALGGRVDRLAPFRLTSLALHIANTALIIVLLYQLFGRPGAAALVGLLFGIHPMTIESIPWIAERKTVLGAFFALAGLLAYVRYARRATIGRYLAVTMLFILALLSKPTTTPLPAVMLLMDLWPLYRFSRRAIVEKLPLFLLAGLSAVVTYVSQRNACGVILPTQREWTYVPFVICHNIVFYLYNIAWPVDLSWHYPFPSPFTWESSWVRAGVIGTVVLLSVLLLSLRWTRCLAVGWLMFFVAIFPTLGIIGFHPVIAADRHAYLPIVGLLVAFGCGLSAASGNLTRTDRGATRATGVVALLAAALALGWGTRHYYGYWQDNVGFRKFLIARDPKDPALHSGLAMAYAKVGRYEDALKEYETASSLGSPNTLILTNWGMVLHKQNRFDEAIQKYQQALKLSNDLPEAQNNLGDALLNEARHEEAVHHFNEALRIKPRFAEAYINLGNAYKAMRRYDEAIAAYNAGLELKPYLDVGRRNLAAAYALKGDKEQAEKTLRRLLVMKPDLAAAHDDLGALLQEMNRTEEGLSHLRRALELEPRRATAHYNMGNYHIAAKAYDSAVASFRRALELDPRLVDARVNLANVLAAQDKGDEAVREYRRALEDDPARASIHNNLAALVESRGFFDEAREHYEKAIELEPDYLDAHYNYAGLLARMEQFDESLRQLDIALRLNPRHTAAGFLKGNILAHLGRNKEAMRAYDAVLAVDPLHADARRMREQLLAKMRPAG